MLNSLAESLNSRLLVPNYEREFVNIQNQQLIFLS